MNLSLATIGAEVGGIPIGHEVIIITGTCWLDGGADCTIVVKPSVIPRTTHVERGLEVREIIAITNSHVVKT